MAQSMGILQHKLEVVKELQGVVDTMKIMASGNISTYEKVDEALRVYLSVIETAFCAVLHKHKPRLIREDKKEHAKHLGIIVFGSDLGMVGQFNELLVKGIEAELNFLGKEVYVWCVGERISSKLQENLRLSVSWMERVPDSPSHITLLVEQMLLDIAGQQAAGNVEELLVFYNKDAGGGKYELVKKQLLPLDREYLQALGERPWPTRMLPEIIPDNELAFDDFVREYLFITLCWACAESIVSENIGRLTAMQRASKNIQHLLMELSIDYNTERQDMIDEELFDVIFGYSAMRK